MNKELNKKYKPEFEHWLNGGKLLVRFTTAKNPYKWYNIEEDFDAKSWNGHYGAQYIIYDEYVELRKALAEGKTIQLDEAKKFSDSTRGWVDLSCESLGISTHLFPVNYYRIKPEEPKFKIGDFIRQTKEPGINVSRIYRIKAHISDILYSVEKNIYHVDVINTKEEYFELWKPSHKELCYFTHDTNTKTSAILREFREISEDGFYVDCFGARFIYC